MIYLCNTLIIIEEANTNVDVREAVNQEEVMEKVRRKQRAWKEKLEQLEDGRLVKKVYTEEIAGKRPRGRPRKKWIDSFWLYTNSNYIFSKSCTGAIAR